MIQAVILAAGIGSRLRPLTDDRPKALVPLGPVPLIDHALDALAEAGVKSMIVVTGYRRDVMERHLDGRRELTIATLENPAYASTNTLASLLVAAPLIEDDFLLIDGDLVFEAAVVSRLGEPGTRLAVDRGRALDAEAVKIAAADDRVVAVGKSLPAGLTAIGESIGMARIDSAVAGRLFQLGRRILAVKPQAYYEAAFQMLIDEGHPVDVVDITGLRWVEVDDHDDYQRARELFVAR